MSHFQPCRSDLLFKSIHKNDQRLGELVTLSEINESPAFHIAGYPDDEGIRINGGRIGASQGPDHIRKYLYKMTPSAWSAEKPLIVDRGNLFLGHALEKRHEDLKEEVTKAIAGNNKWIGLGGGHDYGYPDGAGFLQGVKNIKRKPLVINFDAHLDVRPTDQGISSGTPFYRLLSDTTLPEFDFLEVGLQPQCNSAHHLQWLQERGGQVITLQELFQNGTMTETFLQKAAPLLLQPRPTYLSVDIDAFSSAYAPGCSQSWSTGMIANDFMRLLPILMQRLDIRLLGIYEVSPPLDTDDRTSKLAAQIVHTFLYPS